MYIVINCLGLPFNGNTIGERSLGGSETAAYYVAKELAAQGHDVTIFTTSQEEGKFDGVNYIHCGQVSEHAPLGENFHFYAESTPHDVLIIQRHPHAFSRKYASRINLWWVHDLAQVRNRNEYSGHLWNIDGILTVSEYHKQQWVEALGINPDIIQPITNGVDLALYEKPINIDLKVDGTKKNLLYTSRPERGLEHLVARNGIMERLYDVDKDFHLYVCGYDNTTPQMADYYQYLWQRCAELPNVTFLGSLTKPQLADLQRTLDMHVYPTPGPMQPEFNEVSCITAMECMAAGLPMMVSDRGAIAETTEGSGTILMEPNSDGMPVIQDWVDSIVDAFSDEARKDGYLQKLREKQLEAALMFSWSGVAKNLSENIFPKLLNKNISDEAIAKELLYHSDIYALKNFLERPRDNTPVMEHYEDELRNCYDFAFNDKFKEHYEAYYEYEKNRGVNYGPEKLDGNTRFEFVSSLVSQLPSGATVLDYGCAHGHYTVNLAKRFPDKGFIGVDIEATNVQKAMDWAKDEGLENVQFINGCIGDNGLINTFGEDAIADTNQAFLDNQHFDFTIAAEVVEHVADPVHLVDSLSTYLKDDGTMCITTPYGPWEAQGYQEHYPWRAHLYHFDKADLAQMFGHHREYKISTIPSGNSKWSTPLGSYGYTFKKPTEPSKQPDYETKLINYKPQVQTLSLCMIVKDAQETLLKCLNSVVNVVDEIVIGLDESSSPETLEIIDGFSQANNHIVVRVMNIESPTVIGFDEARNLTIEAATCDWIMWMDSDEFLVHPENIFKYLRNNQFNGYAVQQHHISIEPVGVLKTDLPVRLFRNHLGIKFFGVVHEHPEKELNEGVGFAQAIFDVEIAHSGYTTETIRRKRFHRNIDLLVRDREKYPERYLGKFLWIRDLAQMNQYEAEQNGGRITPQMVDRAIEGIKIWEELLEAKQLRMLVDGMDFYSTLTQTLGDTFEFGFTLDASKLNGGINLEASKRIHGHFKDKDHVTKLFEYLADEKVKDYGHRYF